MDLNGAKVLLTGGSLGIGKETAGRLVDKGARVVITGRDELRLRLAEEETGATAQVFDVSNYESIPRAIEKAVETLGGIDILINNAGIGRHPSLDDLTIEDLEAVYSTNVFGLALTTQAVLPYFKKQNKGNIINIASTAASKGYARGTVYSSSKFALKGMTQCWQAELRPHNIRVCLVNPSEVATAFGSTDRMERKAAPNKLSSSEIAHSIVSILEMDDRGFIPELSVWATNPF